MKLSRQFSPLFLLMLLSACVTINVYFPAAAADTAAKTIVRDVLGETGPTLPEDGDKAPLQEPQSGAGQRHPVLGWLLEFMIPPAHAAANIEINTPAIGAIRTSLKKRQRALQPFFSSGALGLTGDGLVALRDQGAIPLKDRNAVRKLVADENNDRNALYREIARANGHPEWEKDIRRTFARVWIEESPAGTWYMDGGAWKRK